MVFTIEGYVNLLNLLGENKYAITDFYNWKENDKCVILRHDIDTNLHQALSMAEIEYRKGVKSTYFVLLTSDFYNLCSYRNRCILNEIRTMGHSIGLHFDEMAYPEAVGNVYQVTQKIKKEIGILSELLQFDITVFSYHRPTNTILKADIELEGIVNAYGKTFFKQFKYLSDSRMHWREPVLELIEEHKYPRFQILIHPFWYHDKEISIKETLKKFINSAQIERYQFMDENISELEKIIKREEILEKERAYRC